MKYTKQVINKADNYYDINIFNEDEMLLSLSMNLLCETKEEASFKAKVIFDEIKKGNIFTICEKDGTKTTYRIATPNDIKAEPIYRKAEENFFNNNLPEEDKRSIDEFIDLMENISSENFNEKNESSTD